MGRSGYTKMPLSLVTVSRLMPVLVSVSVTAALAMAAPLGSVTVPRMLPVDCAKARDASAQREEHCEAGEE